MEMAGPYFQRHLPKTSPLEDAREFSGYSIEEWYSFMDETREIVSEVSKDGYKSWPSVDEGRKELYRQRVRDACRINRIPVAHDDLIEWRFSRDVIKRYHEKKSWQRELSRRAQEGAPPTSASRNGLHHVHHVHVHAGRHAQGLPHGGYADGATQAARRVYDPVRDL